MSAAVIDPVMSETPRMGAFGMSVEVVNVARPVRVTFRGFEPQGSPALAFVVGCFVLAAAAVVLA